MSLTGTNRPIFVLHPRSAVDNVLNAMVLSNWGSYFSAGQLVLMAARLINTSVGSFEYTRNFPWTFTKQTFLVSPFLWPN